MKVLSISCLLLLLLSQTFGQITTFCLDAYECNGSTITGDNAYCYGYHGCQEATITTTSSMCYGYLACNNATITSTNVFIFGYEAGSYADISASVAVYAHGYRAAYYATIQASGVYAYGYSGAQGADIEAIDTLLVVYFYGYRSGRLADVKCYDGDTCIIKCGTAQGCEDTNFYCYSRAICNYDCSDDENYCPTLYGGIGSDLIDDEITAKYYENLAIKQKIMEEEEDKDDNDLPTEPQKTELKELAVAHEHIINKLDNKSITLSQTEIVFGSILFVIIGVVFGVFISKNKNSEYQKHLDQQ